MQVRPATAEDHALFARFFAAFDVPDPTPDEAWWQRTHANAIFVEEDGVAVAYGQAFAVGAFGNVLHVVVDASARRRGLGKLVMRELAARLRAAGCSRWGLFVKEDNAAAIALYERCGMRVDYRAESLWVPWETVAALPPASLDVQSVDPVDDERIERALGFDPGRLVRFRRMGEDRVLLAARNQQEIAGFIAFDPRFPGAPLFRAREPAIARALFEGVRRHAKAEHDGFRLGVDAHPELVDALLACGARRVLSLLHMSGELPEA